VDSRVGAAVGEYLLQLPGDRRVLRLRRGELAGNPRGHADAPAVLVGVVVIELRQHAGCGSDAAVIGERGDIQVVPGLVRRTIRTALIRTVSSMVGTRSVRPDWSRTSAVSSGRERVIWRTPASMSPS
jgi:hypothetical protein